MKKYFLLLLFVVGSIYAGNKLSPAGLWQTIDDHSHHPASVVRIWLAHGVLYGKIVKIYPVDGNKSTDLCKDCPGKLRNQPILNLTFLGGMREQSLNNWGGGRILDPKNGKIYRCRLKLAADGELLYVRGFLGIPLLGRTQIWRRLS